MTTSRHMTAFLVLLLAATASDDTSAAPYSDTTALFRVTSVFNCTGGGGPVTGFCGEVQSPNLNLTDFSPDSQVSILGQGTVNHAAGQIVASLEATKEASGVHTQSYGDMWVYARDMFVVSGPENGHVVPITGTFAADGFVHNSIDFGFAAAELRIRTGPGVWDETIGGLDSHNACCGDTFSVNFSDSGLEDFELSASTTISATTGTPFQLVYALRLAGQTDFSTGAQDVEANSLNTGILSFDLPAGYTISSALGYTTVPEPTAAALALVGFCFFAKRRRKSDGSLEVSTKPGFVWGSFVSSHSFR